MTTGASAQSVWVGLSGGLIIARLRGEITEADMQSAQEQVLLLLSETDRARVLYDALEMAAPPVELVVSQQEKSDQLYQRGVRIAILTPNTRIAYLARLAFGRGEYRVFYNDLSEAVAWLTRHNEDGNLPRFDP